MRDTLYRDIASMKHRMGRDQGNRCVVMLPGILLILLTVLSLPAGAQKSVDARILYRQSAQGERFELMSRDDAERMEPLFEALFRGESGADIRHAWKEQGFDLVDARYKDVACLALLESEDHKTGRGFYLFSRKRTGPVLMMPHRFHDRDTGAIGCAMFATGLCSAAAWNTVHRYGPEKTHTDGSSDMARNGFSPFAAFTRAFARVHREQLLVQIHGFSTAKRKTPAGREAGIILSAGGELPAWIAPLATNIAHCLDVAARIYPLEIKELGGTTNVSGRILRAAGHSGFVHLEMSRKLRTLLAGDPRSCLCLTTLLCEVRP